VLMMILAFFLLVASPGQLPGVEPSASLPMSHPVFHYDGFVVCVDCRTKVPLWTYEILTSEDLEGDAAREACRFKENTELPAHMRSELADYAGSGFDRGHLVAAGDCKSSKEKMDASFLLSSICAQDPGFNRGAWARLEKHARDLVKTATKVHIVSGPLFLAAEDGSGGRRISFPVIGKNDVAVATHFFKVVVLEGVAGDKKVVAYLLPNEPIPATEPLEKFEVTIEKIERLSGIFFGPLLNPS
jgi:endonuclease G, mitochondrial